ncbi:hypothetical protein DFS33DRAFT_461476 [Desarmillaria ectypa]|nr:hypothetical protein DFS33DRAFT_461476 [Desarmillaria ectypa]
MLQPIRCLCFEQSSPLFLHFSSLNRTGKFAHRAWCQGSPALEYCIRHARLGDSGMIGKLEVPYISMDLTVTTPSVLAPHDPKKFPNIQIVATTREPCPRPLADKWAAQATFYNFCGPTETAIVNTMHKHIIYTPLSIGKQTVNNGVHIIDEYLQPVPVGSDVGGWK